MSILVEILTGMIVVLTTQTLILMWRVHSLEAKMSQVERLKSYLTSEDVKK